MIDKHLGRSGTRIQQHTLQGGGIRRNVGRAAFVGHHRLRMIRNAIGVERIIRSDVQILGTQPVIATGDVGNTNFVYLAFEETVGAIIIGEGTKKVVSKTN